jgi:predicted nucleic acid-binding protein
MRIVFADTSYWIALLNPRDGLHDLAKQVSISIQPVHLISTDEVLVEFLTFYRKQGAHLRKAAAQAVRDIMKDPNITLVPQTRDSFANGLSLYESR